MTIQGSISAKTTAKASAIIPIGPLREAARRMRDHTPRRYKIPVLGYVRVSLSPGKVSLEATDLDAWLTIAVDAEVSGECQVMISAASLAAFSAAASGPVSIEVHPTDGIGSFDIVTLRDGDLTLRRRAIVAAEDFLVAPWADDEAASVEWSQRHDGLLRMLGTVRHCISSEETRYYLNGVFLTNRPNGKTLRAVATDGHRLGCVDCETVAPFQAPQEGAKGHNPGVILPTPVVKLLLRTITRGGNEPLTAEVHGLRARFRIGSTTIIAKLIDGIYPDYRQVMPDLSENIVLKLSEQQVKRLHTASAGISDGFRSTAVKFDASAGKILVSGTEGDEASVPATFSHAKGITPQSFGLNLRYLRDQARVTPVFRLHGSGPRDPFVILGEDPDATFVLMPMRV